MEFTTRRSDGFYLTAEEDTQLAGASKYPSSSSYAPSLPSSSASAPFRWHVGPSDTCAAAASGGGVGDGRGESNFFSEKEHMFDKVVTPSDVGKLNRLVIPKQHAEKHFPLDPTANDKGLLLSFEDRTGKSWRFRYSYWNSSQSYVMTKGWSRFVKEKRLDAGDVVSFGRGIGEAARDLLYIDWKRRPEHHDLPRMARLPLSMAGRPLGAPWIGGGGGGGGGGVSGSRFFIPPAAVYDHRHRSGFGYTAVNNAATSSGSQFLFFGSTMAGRQPLPPPPPPQPQQQLGVQHGSGRGGPRAMVLNSLPLSRSQAAPPKRVRLFGVNIDFSESQGNAAHLPSPSGAAAPTPQLQSTSPTLPFLPLPGGGSFDDSPAASSRTSKEQHLTLDLDL